MLKGTGKAIRQSRKLRREMTLPEILLWKELRRKQTGHHWRKQHPAGAFTLDFYCDQPKLCIEVDGEAHNRGDRPARDKRRDAWLAAHGIFTLRIPATDVLGSLEGVVAYIAETARQRIQELNNSPADGRGGSPRV